MSIQAANDFIARANQDAAIRKMARERLGDIANVGLEWGYDFTYDEFGQAMHERKATVGDEGSCGHDNTCQCEDSGEGACRDQTCQCEDTGSGDSTTCQCVESGSDSTTCQCVIDDGSEKS